MTLGDLENVNTRMGVDKPLGQPIFEKIPPFLFDAIPFGLNEDLDLEIDIANLKGSRRRIEEVISYIEANESIKVELCEPDEEDTTISLDDMDDDEVLASTYQKLQEIRKRTGTDLSKKNFYCQLEIEEYDDRRNSCVKTCKSSSPPSTKTNSKTFIDLKDIECTLKLAPLIEMSQKVQKLNDEDGHVQQSDITFLKFLEMPQEECPWKSASLIEISQEVQKLNKEKSHVQGDNTFLKPEECTLNPIEVPQKVQKLNKEESQVQADTIFCAPLVPKVRSLKDDIITSVEIRPENLMETFYIKNNTTMPLTPPPPPSSWNWKQSLTSVEVPLKKYKSVHSKSEIYGIQSETFEWGRASKLKSLKNDISFIKCEQ